MLVRFGCGVRASRQCSLWCADQKPHAVKAFSNFAGRELISTTFRYPTENALLRSAGDRDGFPLFQVIGWLPESLRPDRVAPGGGRILVRSRRAELVAEACITPMVQPGQVFIPMHYREVNPLIKSVVDPLSRQPSYKFCAVTLEALPPS